LNGTYMLWALRGLRQEEHQIQWRNFFVRHRKAPWHRTVSALPMKR
jgi:hypothetical protein